MTEIPNDLPEEVEVMPLKYGVAFKKAFRNIGIFCEFVKDVTGKEIQVEKVLEEYQYPKPYGNIDIKYDLFAEDTKNRIIIEIQHVMDPSFYDRFLYYHMAGIMEQVVKAEFYRPNREVYTIVVLTSISENLPFDFGIARFRCNPIAEDGPRPNMPVPLEKNHQLIFLNPKLANERTDPKIKPWLDLIADSLDAKVTVSKHITAALQKVIREILSDTMTPAENARLKEERSRIYMLEKAESKGKIEGKLEGKIEGKIEGTQNTIVNFLQARFGSVPATLCSQIQQIQDVKILDHLAVQAATVKTLGQFQKSLPE